MLAITFLVYNLRLHLRLQRDCNETCTIKGVKIPQGMPIMVPCYAVHHDPEIYPDPEKFDPERWDRLFRLLALMNWVTVTEFHSYLITDIWMQSRLGNGFNTPFLQDPPRIVFWFSTGSQKTKKQSVIRMHSCRLVTAHATVSACDLLCWKLSWPWWDYWGSISWNGRRKQR